MSEVGELLESLRGRDIRLSTDGVALHYDGPAEALDDDLVATLRRLKPELVATLSATDPRVERTAPASASQARQVSFTLASDNPAVLTVAFRFALRGPLDETVLRSALCALTRRHAALRTRFALHGDEVWQQVLVAEPVPLTVVEATEAELDEIVTAWACLPFDLTERPPLRASLIRLAPERAEFVLAINHSIGDGWSVVVMIRDLAELYRAELTGTDPRLPVLVGDFVEHSLRDWQLQRDPATDAAVRAWVRDLGSVELPVLPTDRPRGESRTDAGAVWSHELSREFADEITTVAARYGTTAFCLLFAVFGWLQVELTGTRTAAVRSSAANRHGVGSEHDVGVYATNGWLVASMGEARTFVEWLERVTEAVWRRLELQTVPGHLVESRLGPPFTGNPPRTGFSMFGTPMPTFALPGLEPATPFDVELPGARADQTWMVLARADGGLGLVVEYATDLFDHTTVALWGERYLALVRSALRDPTTPL